MFNTKITVYGIFILLALLSGVFLAHKTTKRLKLTKEEISIILL